MLQMFDTYKKTGVNSVDVSEKKIKDHYSQVLVAGCHKPKLSLKDDGSGLFVEDLFKDWELVNKLYEEIINFTYGKKKN